MSSDPLAATLAELDPRSAARPVIGARYEILGLLGAGGMGNVYRAKDLELDELVALKVLKPELVGAPGALERFRREVKLARRVTHPNVARVFDIGEHGGERILTMELVDGEALSAILERERVLAEPRAIEIACAICAGVGAAHASGVVHRDLKPDNVLVARDGRVVVTDFGIARAAAGGSDATRTFGSIVGTPAYMAPEQVEGASEIDARADVYAFGAMLYELLTGEKAWKGDSALAVAAARLLKPPPDPRVAQPRLHPKLAEIVVRAMARSPADRYATMEAIATELAELPISMTVRRSLVPAAPRTPSVGLALPASDKRVGVLPFRNLGPAEDDYLADGLTEDLIDLLSVAKGLRVCSRGVVMRFKGSDRDPREVGRELDVQVVVEGSVRRAGASFRASARLVSVADGFQLWAKRFDAADQNVLALNDDVARAVAEALTVDLGAGARPAGSDPEAVDLYLRARAAAHRFNTRETAREPIELFRRALAKAPDDPRVIAGYVMACARDPDSAQVSHAVLAQEAERALRLAPSLPDAHVAQGVLYFQTQNEAAAVRPLRDALRLAPNNGEAHDLLGRMLSEAGFADAKRHLVLAIALEPTFEISKMALARHLALYEQDWERVAAIADEISFGPMALARFAGWRRDVEVARELRAKFAGSTTLPAGVIALLDVVIAGRVDTAVQFPGAEHTASRTRAFFAQLEAEVMAVGGERQRALAAIETGVAHGLFDLAWLDRCPLFDDLRTDPAFLSARGRIEERASRIVGAYLAQD